MMALMVRGVRGATTVAANDAELMLIATRELLEEVIAVNGIREDDVASVIFTTTPDLNAVYPAQAARQIGWQSVALMGAQEIQIPDGLQLCIRILIHWNTEKSLNDIQHVYMHGAERLRPDLLYPKHKLVLKESDEP